MKHHCNCDNQTTLWHKLIFQLAIRACLGSGCNDYQYLRFFSRRISREKSRLQSWLFVSVFLRPPEVTKIVLSKVLQNFKFHLLAQGTEPKNFPLCRTRPKGPRFQFFSTLRDFFSENNFSPKGPPFNFFGFCDTLGIEKSQRVPLSIFSAL